MAGPLDFLAGLSEGDTADIGEALKLDPELLAPQPRDTIDVLQRQMNSLMGYYGATFGNERFMKMYADKKQQFAAEDQAELMRKVIPAVGAVRARREAQARADILAKQKADMDFDREKFTDSKRQHVENTVRMLLPNLRDASGKTPDLNDAIGDYLSGGGKYRYDEPFAKAQEAEAVERSTAPLEFEQFKRRRQYEIANPTREPKSNEDKSTTITDEDIKDEIAAAKDEVRKLPKDPRPEEEAAYEAAVKKAERDVLRGIRNKVENEGWKLSDTGKKVLALRRGRWERNKQPATTPGPWGDSFRFGE